jgi:hypothetical protein
MDSPDPPPPPDPAQTAAAQAAANNSNALFNTQLARPNITSPIGNVSWTQDKTDPTRWSVAADFDPKMFQNTSSSIGNSSNSSSSFQNAQSSSQSGSTQRATDIDNLMLGGYQYMAPQLAQALARDKNTGTPVANVQDTFAQLRAGQPNLNPAISSATGVAVGNNALNQSQTNRLNNLFRSDMSYNGAPAMPQTSEATRKAVADAIYGRATARLDPRFSQQQDSLQSSLAAQGITQGSEAYNREQQNFAMGRNDAYSSALNDAEQQSAAAMQQLFNMGMGARQQGVSEINALRNQPIQEALAAAQLGQAANNTLSGLTNANTGQLGTAGTVASGLTTADVARRNQELTANMLNDQYLLDMFKAFRSGGQSSLTTSGSTSNSVSQGGGSSSGSSTQVGESLTNNLPNIFNLGSGTAGASAAAPIAQLTQNAYQGDLANYNAQVGSNNAAIAAGASIGAAALPFLI